MLYLIAASIAFSAGLLVYLVLGAAPARSRAMKERMSEMGLDAALGEDQARRRARQSTRLQEVLNYIGGQVSSPDREWSNIRKRLIWAGYREPGALQLFLGIRFGAMGALFTLGVLYGSFIDLPGAASMAVGFVGAFAGWSVPGFMLSRKVNARQTQIQKALPDALDLLVICVEAGLGLNQALVRTAGEMRHVSMVMTTELSTVNLSIRAGTPRDRALLDLADRTGVKDLRSLATMIIQTERFGTSVAHSLRIHADTMRTKRRQRAEEAAAKTTIKMVFPLAFCIFPALFVVVLGPAIITVLMTFAKLG